MNAWDTVSSSNNQLHVVEELDIATQFTGVLTIKKNPYDTDGLRAAIEGQLNSAGKKVGGGYTVTRSTAAGDTSSSASGTAYRFSSIELKGGGGFQIPPEKFLRDPAWNLPGYSRDLGVFFALTPSCNLPPWITTLLPLPQPSNDDEGGATWSKSGERVYIYI